jgi:hypothetical protein
MASICSVARIAPISAAMAAETRPASISAASTGPSSRVMPRATICGITCSALNRPPPVKMFRARAAPVKTAVRPTTGSEKKPIATSWRTNWIGNHGGVKAATPRRANTPTRSDHADAGQGRAPDAADRIEHRVNGGLGRGHQ